MVLVTVTCKFLMDFKASFIIIEMIPLYFIIVVASKHVGNGHDIFLKLPYSLFDERMAPTDAQA